MCARAQEAGLREICFAEHVEIGHIYNTNWTGKLDWNRYSQEIEKARAEYPALKIHIGAEAGLQPHVLEETGTYLGKLPLDFILASQHVCGGADPYMDKTFYENRARKEAYMEFLKETYQCINHFNDFDVIGHLSYVAMFDPHPTPLEYHDYPEILDEILRSLAERGKGVEVNTTGYYFFDVPQASLSVLRRFRELGGEVVTTGSDAHFPVAVGHNFDLASQLIREAGFRDVCTFEERKAIFHRLK